MGKATKTNRKRFELKLSLPDQKHLSYLSDGHAICNSARLAKGESFQNFESYLLDAIFARANQDVSQYANYLKKAKEAEAEKEIMDKTYEVDDSAIRNEVKNESKETDTKSEGVDATELDSEDTDTDRLESES